MNEEELFCKLFPEYAVNGKPLSPYFDLFERGYEEAENRIEELEKACDETQELLDRQIEAAYRLDKENAELKHTIATVRQEKDNVSMHAKAMEVVAKTRSDQFTKAKNIIKNLMIFAEIDNREYEEAYKEAEQFINEVYK